MAKVNVLYITLLSPHIKRTREIMQRWYYCLRSEKNMGEKVSILLAESCSICFLRKAAA